METQTPKRIRSQSARDKLTLDEIAAILNEPLSGIKRSGLALYYRQSIDRIAECVAKSGRDV